MLSIPAPLVSEALLQAEFYHKARLASFHCSLEYSTPAGRLDIAIFSEDWDFLLCIVEVKLIPPNPHSRQIRRYQSLGVPVLILSAFDQIPNLISFISDSYIHNQSHIGVRHSFIRFLPKPKRRPRIKSSSQDDDLRNLFIHRFFHSKP